MKKIIIYIFCISFSFEVISQNLVFLSDSIPKSKTKEYFDGYLLLSRGNMVIVGSVNKKIFSDEKEFYIDKNSNKKYYFSNSAENVYGWLLVDKKRHRTLYFDREMIIVKDNIKNTILFEISKLCGFDVFLYSWKCGYSDAYYDFSSGKLFFYRRRLILKDKKIVLNVLTGNINI